MYPDCSKLEMFARHNRPGWTSWGHEITDDIIVKAD
jgi:N6-adenosine-specific RNA methylase IME4